ncbi:MAG: hypothetical protein H6809_04305 [Phycisphaeraceae bacterium]|nr:hypothetical protein [Phycisphaeraceae bacterium]
MTPADAERMVIESGAAGRIDPTDAPARAGVVLLLDRDRRPILLATTADARAFLRRRLGAVDRGGEQADAEASNRAPPGESVESPKPSRTPQADLSAITARVEFTPAGSGLEADLAFLRIARERLPASWEALTERWRAWFLHLDPAAASPVWRKTNLGDAPRSGAHDPASMRTLLATLVGPMANKDAAGRFGEAIDDVFDLCRFPKELALAPRGTACAYKEMGKCPAPCDGSEARGSYRARVAGALESLRCGAAGRAEPIERRMREAAARQNYAAAAGHKASLEALRSLEKPAFREARPLDVFRFVAILGSGRAGWARAWGIDAFSCEPIVDLDGARAKAAAAALGDAVASWFERRERSAGVGIDPMLLAIVSRHLLAPRAKRRGGFVRLTDPAGVERGGEARFDADQAARCLRSAARTEASDVEEFDRATLA